MDDIISVIIPLYNVEQYLPECMESILSQTYRELEIIVVDDGSTDGCPGICDEYAKKDPRIRVIHQANCGVSVARNRGLAIASGKYLMFVDSDDLLIENFFIEDLYRILKSKDADIVISETITFHVQSEIPAMEFASNHSEPRSFQSDEAINHICYHHLFGLSPWGRLYKRELFFELSYPEGRNYEDLATFYKLFDRANQVIFYPNIHYGYRARANSIMSKPVDPYLAEIAQDMLDYLREKRPNCERAAEALYCMSLFTVLTQNLDWMSRQDRILYIKRLRPYFFRIALDQNIILAERMKWILLVISPWCYGRVRVLGRRYV